MILNKHSPKYRELLWRACCLDCFGNPAPDGIVLCNICHMTVVPGDEWDESHIGAPAALAGKQVGVAHRECNRRHNNEVVTPMVAKAKRQKRRHVGITGPGLSDQPLPCGKRSKMKKTMRGEVVARVSQSEAHREMMRRREIGETQCD